MCLKSNTFQLDSSSTMNIWSLVVDINFTLGLVCPITFASLQTRVRLYTGVSVHGGKLTGTSYGGGGWPGPFGPPSVSVPGTDQWFWKVKGGTSILFVHYSPDWTPVHQFDRRTVQVPHALIVCPSGYHLPHLKCGCLVPSRAVHQQTDFGWSAYWCSGFFSFDDEDSKQWNIEYDVPQYSY